MMTRVHALWVCVPALALGCRGADRTTGGAGGASASGVVGSRGHVSSSGGGGDDASAVSASGPSSSGTSVAGTGSSGGASSALDLSGTLTDEAGLPVAGAHVALAANSALSAETAADGSFEIAGDQPRGFAPPPLYPVTRPVEHTLVASKSGYLVTYRGVPGSQALGLALRMESTIPATTGGSPVSPTVAEYRGDRIAAVTMTFDDCKLSQITTAWPLFDQYGYKATFYVNSGSIGPDQLTTWPMWSSVAAAGHEIGNHARFHWVKPECTPENAIWNHDVIFGGYQDIAANIGAPPLTFAFPADGQSPCTEPLVTASGHVDFRRNNHSHGPESDRRYPEGDELTVTSAIADIDEVIAHTPNWNGAPLSWFLFYMHEITPERVAVLEAMLDYVSAHDDQVWCAGYGEVTLYEREREQSTLVVAQHGPRTVTFILNNGLDPTIFDRPLTVDIPLPEDVGVVEPTAFRGDLTRPVEVRERSHHLMVDVVPGPQPVHVTW